MSEVNYVDVFRAAHQLALDHGHNAYLHAAKLAREANVEGKTNEAEFWNAVSAALTPR